MTIASEVGRLQQLVAQINEGNIGSLRENLAESYYNYTPQGDEPKANEVYYGIVSDLKRAMSDLHIALTALETKEDRINAQMTMRGTTDGPLWGAPATNKSVSWTVNVSVKPRDGRFAVNLDDVTLPALIGTLRQIDMVPPPDEMDKPSRYPVQIPEAILQALYNGEMAQKACDHLQEIRVWEPEVDVCEQCVTQGDVWPALRMCLICGFVGCCDTSKNKHMKQHYEQTGHGIFRSIRLDEGWGWCYDDNTFFSRERLEKHYRHASMS
jgi:hypothetical protein